MKNLVVLISGNGSNLQAILDACQQRRIQARVRAVFSNKASAFGLERAHKAGIHTGVLSARNFASREAFDRQLIQEIDGYHPDVVVLAGYMRILTAPFVNHYLGRLINIHPSLLPAYPGLDTHRRVLEQGDHQHGASVHFVTEQLDAGPVIIQGKVPVLPDDDAVTLSARVHQQEHLIYPQAISWIVDGRLHMRDNAAWLDGRCLPDSGAELIRCASQCAGI